MSECANSTNPPTEWREIQGRHLWKVRACFDPSLEHRGWFWAAHVHSPTRNVSMSSTSHLDDYQYVRWSSAEEALSEAHAYLVRWEEGRPGF